MFRVIWTPIEVGYSCFSESKVRRRLVFRVSGLQLVPNRENEDDIA